VSTALGGDARFLSTSPENLHEALREFRWLKVIRRGSGPRSFIPAWNRHEMNRSQIQPLN
jgi:hypothetical protein